MLMMHLEGLFCAVLLLIIHNGFQLNGHPTPLTPPYTPLTPLTHTPHRGLVPLHNACSYGHYEVVESLVNANANVNAVDLWKFTPLHEAAAKGKYEICKLLIKVCVWACVCVCGRWLLFSSHRFLSMVRTQTGVIVTT